MRRVNTPVKQPRENSYRERTGPDRVAVRAVSDESNGGGRGNPCNAGSRGRAPQLQVPRVARALAHALP